MTFDCLVAHEEVCRHLAGGRTRVMASSTTSCWCGVGSRVSEGLRRGRERPIPSSSSAARMGKMHFAVESDATKHGRFFGERRNEMIQKTRLAAAGFTLDYDHAAVSRPGARPPKRIRRA